MPENPSTVAEIIRQAEAGTCAPAIEVVKRYMHNEGAKLRLCRAYHEEQPGPSPTPSELYRLADVLRDWGNARGVDMGPLQEFIRQEQRRLSSLISASGFVLSQPFSKADWSDAALKADELLNHLKRLAPRGGGVEIVPGGISYGNAIVSLSGKPLACIRALVDAHHHRLGWEILRDRVWGRDAYTEPSTIKNAISDARDALRQLARKAGKHVEADYDPLPCVNQGKDLAWKLEFPE